MTNSIEWMLIFMLIFGGFFGLFYVGRVLEQMFSSLRRTRDTIEQNARERLLKRRRELGELEHKRTLWLTIHRMLEYSSLKRWFPGLEVESFVVWNVGIATCLFLIGGLVGGIVAALSGIVVWILVEGTFITLMRGRNQAVVDRNLLKLMDFLGNYSMTAGELTGILRQVSVYMEEPLRSVLEECDAESRITGDVSLALLSMLEKIEHPQFASFVRNLEITSRYSADYTALISESRKSIRAYLQAHEEEKGMLKEAFVNMTLLGILSVLVLLVVGKLIGVSVESLLFHSIPGHIALGGMGLIALLFVLQAVGLRR